MKYRLILALRVPNRRLRLEGEVDESELEELWSQVPSGKSANGVTKGGHPVIVPMDNVAYIEAVPVKESTDASPDA